LALQAGLLLELRRPEDALVVCDKALQIASAIDYLPMIWRIRATKARALEGLGAEEAAIYEWQTAATLIQALAGAIGDSDLQQGFIADPLIASVIVRAQGQIVNTKED
jgi:hypothetical protein